MTASPQRFQSKIQSPKSELAIYSDAAVQLEQPVPAAARHLVSEDETIILMLRPSVLFIPLSSLAGLAFIAAVTFALAYAYRYATQFGWNVGWNDTQAFGLGLALASLRLGWQFLEWANRVYILTDRRVITRGGVLRVSVYEAQLKHIQNTIVFARLRERLFGLGSIGFATAGSESFQTFWTMIRSPYAVHKTVLDAIRRYGN